MNANYYQTHSQKKFRLLLFLKHSLLGDYANLLYINYSSLRNNDSNWLKNKYPMQVMKNLSYLTPLLLCTLLWWILTEGAHAWVVGGPAILLATWVAVRLQNNLTSERPRLNWLAVPPFIVFFFIQSIKAGLDVARRTLSIPADINPGTTYYCTSLPAGSSRLLFGAILGLFPGSLCTAFTENNELVLHVLDTNADTAEDCRRLERHIARLFNMEAK